jgi:hypothetical protein
MDNKRTRSSDNSDKNDKHEKFEKSNKKLKSEHAKIETVAYSINDSELEIDISDNEEEDIDDENSNESKIYSVVEISSILTKLENKVINLIGLISMIFPCREFNEKKLVKILVSDETSNVDIQLSIWNENITKYSNLEINSIYRFTKIKLRKITGKQIKYNIGSYELELLPTDNTIINYKYQAVIDRIRFKQLDSIGPFECVNIKGVVKQVIDFPGDECSRIELDLTYCGQDYKIVFWNDLMSRCIFKRKDVLLVFGLYTRKFNSKTQFQVTQFTRFHMPTIAKKPQLKKSK